MDIAKIIYYRPTKGKSITVSLRDLCLREECELEDVFYVVKDAIDTNDLLCRLRRICCDCLEFESETPEYIRFTVVDVYGNTNYLKFRKKKEK